MTGSTTYWLWWQLKWWQVYKRYGAEKKWISNTIICRYLVIVGPQARTSAGIFYQLIWWVHRESITWALKTLVSSHWKANIHIYIYTYTYIHTYIYIYIYNYIYIYISWDWLILPQNWKWPWVCGSKIISSWPYWGKPPIIFHQFPIDSVLDIFHGQNGRKTEPSQSEASYIVDDCTYPQYILTISPSGIGPNPHHIPNDHRSLHELPLFTTQPRAQRGPLVNYLATACGGDQNILGDRIKHPSPQL